MPPSGHRTPTIGLKRSALISSNFVEQAGDCGMRFKFFDLERMMQVACFALTLTYGRSALAYDPVDCLDDVAKIDPEIVVGLASRLCSGTWTQEPVKCYAIVSKVDRGIPRGIAIDLCAGSASSEQTVACYVRAGEDRKLNRGLSTTLCGTRKVEK